MKKQADAPTSVVTDEELIELFWQRDETAIDKTDGKYGKLLFRIAYNILHDRLDCEECKNDTYLGVWNTVPPTRPAVFPAFITRIMRNVAVKRYKEKMSQKRIPSEMTVSLEELEAVLHGGGAPEAEYNTRELGRYINEYVKTLSDRQQYIFIGRFYMAETIEYIADKLGVGVGTVHRDIGKIKEGLKLYLDGKGVCI